MASDSAIASSCVIHCLPDDLLGRVLAEAGFAQGRHTSLVCWRWHRVFFAEQRLWRSFDLNNVTSAPEAQWAHTLRLLCRVGPHVRSLGLSGSADLSLPRVVAALRCLQPNRQAELEQARSGSLLTGAVCAELARFTHLHSLKLKNAGGSRTHSMLAQHTALTRLDLADTRFSSKLPQALVRLPRLASLSLDSYWPLPALHPLSALGNLTRLDLNERWSVSSGLVLPLVTDMWGLRLLTVWTPAMQPPGGAVYRVRKPWDLDLDDFYGKDEEDEEVAADWGSGALTADYGGEYRSRHSPTNGCLHLEEWHLDVRSQDSDSDSDSDDDDDDADAGGGGWARGTSGSQGRCNTLAPLLKAVVPPRSRLGRLQLSECILGRRTFEGCAPFLDGIHTLDVSNCRSELSDKEFAAALDCLLRQTPRLRKLTIKGEDKRHDLNGGPRYGVGLSVGLPRALETELPQLISLRIMGCYVDSLPDGPYWTGLVHLDVSCNEIGGFPASLTTATRLRSLRMQNCYLNALSVEAAEMLAQLPRLRTVHLAAEGVHNPGVALLASKRVDVKIT